MVNRLSPQRVRFLKINAKLSFDKNVTTEHGYQSKIIRKIDPNDIYLMSLALRGEPNSSLTDYRVLSKEKKPNRNRTTWNRYLCC